MAQATAFHVGQEGNRADRMTVLVAIGFATEFNRH